MSGLGQGFEAANATAALRLSIQSDAASVGAMSSVNLTGLVKLWQNGQVAATWPAAIGPGRAFYAIQPITSPALGLQLIDSSGNIVAQTGRVP